MSKNKIKPNNKNTLSKLDRKMSVRKGRRAAKKKLGEKTETK